MEKDKLALTIAMAAKPKYIRLYLISMIPVVLYAFYMFKYYNILFFVPDFLTYCYFGDLELPAQDGFSSLFIKISQVIRHYPAFAHFFSLSLLATSIFLICHAAMLSVRNKNITVKILIVLSIYSWGIWYYFCGKLYYDFPFTVFSFAVTFIILIHIIDLEYPRGNVSGSRLWYCFYLLCGFTLSWKPYNIFPVAGIICLTLLWRKESLLSIIANLKQYIIFSLFFISGYCLGLYRLFTDFFETLKGIRAYEVPIDHLRFIHHFFKSDFTDIIWDHVVSASFSTGVFCIASMTMLLIFPFLFVKNKLYGFLGLLFLGLYCFYINLLSPGYQWHAFPLGLFFIIFFCFCLMEISRNKNHIPARALTFAFIMFFIQSCNNFGYYIPIQNLLQISVHDRIATAHRNQSLIFDMIDDFLEKNGIQPDMVHVELNVKRSNVNGTVFSDERWSSYTGTNNQGVMFIEIKQKDASSNTYIDDYWNRVNDINKSKYLKRPCNIIYESDAFRLLYYAPFI